MVCAGLLSGIRHSTSSSVAIEPGEQRVYPADGAVEPSVGACGLAAETEDEVTKSILTEGQAHIHEVDMLEAAPVGILQHVPDGHDMGMQPGIGLSAEGCIPQIGLMLTVDDSRTADDVVAIAGQEEMTVVTAA